MDNYKSARQISQILTEIKMSEVSSSDVYKLLQELNYLDENNIPTQKAKGHFKTKNTYNSAYLVWDNYVTTDVQNYFDVKLFNF
mgnify:CR=1 FL=1